jgi:SAM-dependent methyltransferase
VVGRIDPEKTGTRDEYLLYLRHLFTYEFAAKALPRDSIVLEIGCGEGYGSSLLYGSTSCSFQLYDGRRIPFKDNSFLACVSFQVVEHLNYDRNFVSEVRRVLRKGGVFILTTPNRAYRLRPGQKPFNPFHVREYYYWELENLLKPFFGEVKVLGITATEEVREIETRRVRPSVYASLDRLNLRRFMSEGTRKEVVAILDRLRFRAREPEDFRVKYSTRDFQIVDDARKGIDFLAICSRT